MTKSRELTGRGGWVGGSSLGYLTSEMNFKVSDLKVCHLPNPRWSVALRFLGSVLAPVLHQLQKKKKIVFRFLDCNSISPASRPGKGHSGQGPTCCRTANKLSPSPMLMVLRVFVNVQKKKWEYNSEIPRVDNFINKEWKEAGEPIGLEGRRWECNGASFSLERQKCPRERQCCPLHSKVNGHRALTYTQRYG